MTFWRAPNYHNLNLGKVVRYGSRILYKPFKYAARYAGRKLAGTITHVSTREDLAALTFDDGPDPIFTPRLLDILKRHHAQATFFMIGESAERYPELVRQVADAGHAIGNHSWDHTSLPLISGGNRRAQIRACKKAIAPYGARLFRPPFGHQSIASRLDLLLSGYKVVTWNIGVPDFLGHDGNWIAEQIIQKVRPGSVILLHDGLYQYLDKQYINREATLLAVDRVLTTLSDRFRFVSIPDLLRCGRPQRQNWFVKPDIDLLNRIKKVEQYDARRYNPRTN